jgi:hypothetical protein
MLANRIEQCIKRIMYYNQVKFIPAVQGWFNRYESVNITEHIKSMKGKTHTIVSIDAETSTHLIIKSLNKLSIEGATKATHENTSAIIIFNGEKQKVFHEKKGKLSTLCPT